MKTNLPEAITTIAEAKAFLRELHTNREIYHPEDDAHTIVSWDGMPDDEAVPTPEQCDQLNKLMEDIYNLPGNDGRHVAPMVFDPCGYGLGLNAIATIKERYIAESYMTYIYGQEPMSGAIGTALSNLTGLDMESADGVELFISKYGQLNLAQFIEAVEPALGTSEDKPAQTPTPFFTERIQAIGNEAEAWLLANVKEKIVLLDTSEAYDQFDAMEGLPDCECWGTSGISQGWADIVAIEPYENNIRVHVMLKDNGMEEETALSMLDAYSAANLADHIIASRAAALED